MHTDVRMAVRKEEGKSFVSGLWRVETESESRFARGDSGKGTIELFFQKPNPSELDDLISTLSDVGLAEDKKIEIEYEIQADQHIDDDEYDVLIRLTPKQVPNFMGMTFKVFTDNDYDMSRGIGKIVAEEIEKQIL